MKLSSLSLSELKAKHGRHLAAAYKVWAEIQRRERMEEEVTDECPDFSDYSQNTRNLLEATWDAPGRKLSKAEIGEAVTGDDLQDDVYIRQVKKRANAEMKKMGFPYRLKPVRGEGYKLVRSVTKVSQNDNRQRKPRKTSVKNVT